ncbi:hypothetical protein JCM19237_5057 [Photobacterium aphoticum]|uniref:Uncharacterized protein n=1 Tax=Photobacterium aphoticum TaxID=754436 RepID=A0A090QK24_9GAMM|nr:hypothetical protein JCM19237_5057 [Photobacterium aphoticum]
MPVKVVDQAETTVLGAAMYAFTGAGIYASITEAQDAMKPNFTVVLPQSGPQSQLQQQGQKELETC